jgi:hypothetical protein
MGAGHAAAADKKAQVDSFTLYQSGQQLYQLGQYPGAKRNYQNPIGNQVVEHRLYKLLSLPAIPGS